MGRHQDMEGFWGSEVHKYPWLLLFDIVTAILLLPNTDKSKLMLETHHIMKSLLDGPTVIKFFRGNDGVTNIMPIAALLVFEINNHLNTEMGEYAVKQNIIAALSDSMREEDVKEMQKCPLSRKSFQDVWKEWQRYVYEPGPVRKMTRRLIAVKELYSYIATSVQRDQQLRRYAQHKRIADALAEDCPSLPALLRLRDDKKLAHLLKATPEIQKAIEEAVKKEGVELAMKRHKAVMERAQEKGQEPFTAEDLPKCSICYDVIYERDRALLECSHPIHVHCLRLARASEVTKCPACTKQVKWGGRTHPSKDLRKAPSHLRKLGSTWSNLGPGLESGRGTGLVLQSSDSDSDTGTSGAWEDGGRGSYVSVAPSSSDNSDFQQRTADAIRRSRREAGILVSRSPSPQAAQGSPSSPPSVISLSDPDDASRAAASAREDELNNCERCGHDRAHSCNCSSLDSSEAEYEEEEEEGESEEEDVHISLFHENERYTVLTTHLPEAAGLAEDVGAPNGTVTFTSFLRRGHDYVNYADFTHEDRNGVIRAYVGSRIITHYRPGGHSSERLYIEGYHMDRDSPVPRSPPGTPRSMCDSRNRVPPPIPGHLSPRQSLRLLRLEHERALMGGDLGDGSPHSSGAHPVRHPDAPPFEFVEGHHYYCRNLEGGSVLRVVQCTRVWVIAGEKYASFVYGHPQPGDVTGALGAYKIVVAPHTGDESVNLLEDVPIDVGYDGAASITAVDRVILESELDESGKKMQQLSLLF